MCRHVGVSAVAWHYGITESSFIVPSSSQRQRPYRQQCRFSRTRFHISYNRHSSYNNDTSIFHRETTMAAVSDNCFHFKFDFSHLSHDYVAYELS